MFNIQENENETTGNFVAINLKQKMNEMKDKSIVNKNTLKNQR